MSIHVVVTGRLTKDPHYSENDRGGFAAFGIASNDYTNGAQVTNFREVKVFGAKSKYVNQYFKKGSSVEVRGREIDEEYNGNKKITVYADDVGFVGGKSHDDNDKPQETNKAVATSPVVKPSPKGTRASRQVTTKPPVETQAAVDEDIPF